MSTFSELRGLRSEVDGDTLKLPIGDAVYEFSKSIPMRSGLALAEARVEAEKLRQAAREGKELNFDPDNNPGFTVITEEQLRRDLIGAEWDRMLTDGVHDTEFDRVYLTLFTWHMVGEAAAKIVWEKDFADEGDARPPAPSASKARTTSRTSSTQKRSAATKPKQTPRRNSAGATSSKAGN